MDQFIGAIFSYGFNFAPTGNMKCAGQVLPISQYDTLFALIGTTYGGDGVTTFNMPDLQGRVPLHMSSSYTIGQASGNESITLTTANLPAHSHTVLSAKLPAAESTGSGDPTNNYYGGASNDIGTPYAPTGTAAMGAIPPVQSGITGSGVPLDILSPFLVINYCIATEGIFPQRN